jgi:hypothetical protein
MNTSASLSFLIPLCLAGVFGIIGVGLLVFGLVQRRKAKLTETWPTASGAIVSARLDQSMQTHRRDGHTYTSTSYNPVIEYTYQIGGKAYQGNRVFAGATMSYDLGTAQGIVNRYQPGMAVTVHYDPADPTQAVLETTSKGGNLFFILGAVFAILGMLGCCIGVLMVVVSQN